MSLRESLSHKSSDSEILGFKLLYLCLSSFGPVTDEMKNILRSHIAEVATPKVQRYMSMDTLENVAANCWVALEQAMENVEKAEPPSLDHIKSITVRST